MTDNASERQALNLNPYRRAEALGRLRAYLCSFVEAEKSLPVSPAHVTAAQTTTKAAAAADAAAAAAAAVAARTVREEVALWSQLLADSIQLQDDHEAFAWALLAAHRCAPKSSENHDHDHHDHDDGDDDNDINGSPRRQVRQQGYLVRAKELLEAMGGATPLALTEAFAAL
jgi:hypothetical protein